MIAVEVPRKALDAQVMLQSIRMLRAMGRAVGQRRSLVDFEIKLTRSLGLFDRRHYLSQLDAGEVQGMSAMRHYVLYGDAAGLSPCPMFDVEYFDAHCGERHGLNRLLHYGLVMRFKGMSPTAWFDAEYYLQANPDVQHAGLDPLEHFQRWGWREGRNPLPGLDMRRILQAKPHWRVAKDNPLVLLATGAFAHLLHDQPEPEEAPQATAPPAVPEDTTPWLDPAFWAELRPRRWPHPPRMDVIVPVYAGALETLRCLWSVLTAPVNTPHQLIVINDAGPDPTLNAMLRNLAARDLFQLETHRQNQGFVKTANAGLRLHPDHDVVLLNSDTEVYGNWLDRLLQHAHRHPDLGSITPLSNNASICSYPEPQSDNRLPLEVSVSELDALAAKVNAGAMVTAPTGVGFCMYVRRQALEDAGLLDERRFGRGYGEENDLCQRFLRAGWRNAIACDVVVRHVGSVSFKGEAAERTARGLKVLAKLHPRYEADVQRHIAIDPAWIHRARLDLARLQRLSEPRNVLLVCHNRGGGTERHLVEESRRLQAQGFGVFEMRPSHQPGCVAIMHPGMYGLYNLAALPPQPNELFDEVLRTLRITEIHVHHLIDFPSGLGDVLIATAQRLQMRLRQSIHDYYAICPRVNLVNANGRFCGQPSTDDCNACLQRDHLHHQFGRIEHWRAGSLRLLQASQEVVAPSPDVQRRLQMLSPSLPIRVEPHEPQPPAPLATFRGPRPGEACRVLVVGAISRIKGFDVVLQLARTVSQRQLPLELALLGYSMDDTALRDAGVDLLGRYFDNELAEKIQDHAPHLILVPSIWPETYCYVLSAAMGSGRRVAVFDLGAQAERVRGHHPDHLVLPLWLADTPEELALRLMPAPAPVGVLERAA